MKVEKGKGNSSNFEYPLIKKGSRPAVLTGIIDIGVQAGGEYRGEKKKDSRQFIPVFTLVKDTFKDNEGELRFHKVSPWPIKIFGGAERGHFYDFCEAVDPEHEVMQKCSGEMGDLLGNRCLVNIYHTEPKMKDGKEVIYSNMGGVSPCPEDYPMPDYEGDLILFDTEEPSEEMWGKLNDRTKDLIKDGVNFAGSDLAALVAEWDAGSDAQAADPQPEEDDDDDAPY